MVLNSRFPATGSVADAGEAVRPSYHDLLERAPLKPLPDGTRLFNEGDRGASIYFIERGEVSLILCTEQGTEVEVERRSAGSLVGFECIFDSYYKTSAVTSGSCRVSILNRSQMLQFMDDHPGLSRGLLRDLLAEISLLQQRLLDLAGRCAIERMAALLLRESVSEDGRLVFRLPWGSKQHLARRLGIKQETFSRVLQGLVDKGGIRVESWGLVILDRNALEGLLR
jgi:CRP-like cAMP-binding protein